MSDDRQQRAADAAPAIEATTMCQAFQRTVRDMPDRIALRERHRDEQWTWVDAGRRVRRIAAGLATLGVGHGDVVALMLTNRPEFHLIDAAVFHLGAVPVSVYNTSPTAGIEHVLRDSGARMLVTEPRFRDAASAAARTAGVAPLVVLDDAARDGETTLAAVEAGGDPAFDFDAAWRAVRPEDVLTIIYTSGTTGPPKGVELTHANLTAAVRAYDQVIDFPREGGVISWLPMAHIAERNCSHYMPMMRGFTATSCRDGSQILAALPDSPPAWFFAVPRVFEKLQAAIEAAIAAEPGPARYELEQAVALGRRRTALAADGTADADVERAWAAADRGPLAALRTRFGLHRLRATHVGAAPCPADVIRFFHAIGVPLAELWGLTESCAVGCSNPQERIKIGTVGPVVPGLEVRLADDGEVLLRGPVVMQGYRGLPEATAEAIDADGWLRTGDVGVLDEDGYLSIVDRKKDLIINAAGKNMAPTAIESAVQAASPLIDRVVAVGDRRPYVTALIVLDRVAGTAFAEEHGITADLPALAADPRVVAEVQRAVDRANDGLASVERVRRFAILDHDWTPGGDELTPTMKLRRKQVVDRYAERIDRLYATATAAPS